MCVGSKDTDYLMLFGILQDQRIVTRVLRKRTLRKTVATFTLSSFDGIEHRPRNTLRLALMRTLIFRLQDVIEHDWMEWDGPKIITLLPSSIALTTCYYRE